jgi:hypothetical protein
MTENTGAFNYQRTKDMLPFFTSKADELCSALLKLVVDHSDQPIECMLYRKFLVLKLNHLQ